MAWFPGKRVFQMLDELEPDAIHIPAEGTIGVAGRRYCKKRGLPYTSSYHTQYPHYLKHYFRIPMGLTYRLMRWFHGQAKATLVPTQRVKDELEARGFANIVVWSRGVDTSIFKPWEGVDHLYDGLARPVWVYAGRVSVEKNLEAFLKLDLPGTKVIVGNGPAKAMLENKYPDAHFAGYQFGEDLGKHYAAADVFVFPSLTDTYGVVMIEAMACGLPVAAFPVTGPIDVVQDGVTGALDEDLGAACQRALELKREDAIAFGQAQTWRRCAEIVLENLALIER
jgi:glycosyltransferase involved in cell wall biosynthesis